MDFAARTRAAIAAHQSGDLKTAEQHYRALLDADPAHFTGQHLLGVLRAQQGRNEEAATLIEAALAQRPDDFSALSNLGPVLLALGRHDAALRTYDRALALKPDFRLAHHNRGVALASLGRHAEAVTSYNRALKLQPGFAMTLHLRGLAQWHQGRFAEALASHDAALQSDGRNPVIWSDRAVALSSLGREHDALASCSRALGLDPRHVPALLVRGGVLRETARWGEALADFDRAIALAPKNAEAWDSRGVLLSIIGRGDEALDCFDRALALQPDFPQALDDRATLLAARRDYPAAIADLEKLLALAPERDLAEGDLLTLKLKTGDWRGFGEAVARLEDGIRAGRLPTRPMVLQSVCADSATLLACAKAYAAKLYPSRPTRTPSLRKAERLRIGYLAAEFRAHPTAYLLAGVFEQHDRAGFEIVAIDNGGGDGSATRARLEAAFDSILDISQLSDAAAAQAIAATGIDILVDLNGFAGDGRMGVLARRPAPLAVTWLGYPGSTGTSYIDYILADAVVIPPGEERFYSEAVARLPFTYQANDGARGPVMPTDRAAHGLPEAAFIFCNFNQGYKLTPPQFAVWMRILAAVPGSVLWLWEDNALSNTALKRAATAHGIAAERLVFAPSLPMTAHVSRMALADLFLDGGPYNAHTTASDALWAGLPLLTRRGTAFAGRVAASLLAAAGLPELVVEDDAEYERRAIALATERTELAALRARLAQNRASCPLFDTARFTRHLESAYRIMHARQIRGAAPEDFAVPDQGRA